MRRVLIYGAGEAGEMVLAEVRRRPEENIEVQGFMDDDAAKQGLSPGGVPVRGGRESLREVIRTRDINEVIIAMPSIRKPVIREIVRICKQEKVKLLIVPSTREIIEGNVSYEQIKSIHPADLLDREEVHIESDKIRACVRGRVVLVTGAAGSIGSELVRKLLTYKPRELLLLDISENGLFYLLQTIGEGSPHAAEVVRTRVSDIKNGPMLEEIFMKHKPEVVYHAAAYKHVPIMEDNVRMIFLNNVVGTANLLRLALYYGVERFIGISTDKAVYPVSVMGKTKRIGELLVKCYAGKGLRASSVRFGNVLGSNGSVITVFKRQIERGGPVTITSPGMERYFMTVHEAASLVLQAGTLEGNGNIYVLEMGDPIRIRDLAENLIILSGCTPGVDMEIQYTGIRAGEKLREELFHKGAKISESPHRGIYIETCDVDCSGLVELVESSEEKMHLIEELELTGIMDRIIGSSLPASTSSIASK
ncbi:MAG: polysaccharide biosynthesis protein [Spirochaetes bacterium]|nr:polysaccharide biosynthesis protein [Spirochaetota bacterium]